MSPLHTRVADRANASGIMITPAAVADIERWLCDERFAPVTGFIPGDGDEPGITLARDNPTARNSQHAPAEGGEGDGVGVRGLHGRSITSTEI